MLSVLFVLGTLVCAMMAIAAHRLLTASLWLAAVSAQISVIFYILGLQEVAVIELSVGAGLVTILFVFAISIAGDDTSEPQTRRTLLRGIALFTTIVATGLLLWGVLPAPAAPLNAPADITFNAMVWQQRGLDTLVQVVLIATGSVSVVALLAAPPQASSTRTGSTHGHIQETSLHDTAAVAGLPEGIEEEAPQEVAL